MLMLPVAVKFAENKPSENNPPPCTANAAPGVVVPIPTRPLLVTVNKSPLRLFEILKMLPDDGFWSSNMAAKLVVPYPAKPLYWSVYNGEVLVAFWIEKIELVCARLELAVRENKPLTLSPPQIEALPPTSRRFWEKMLPAYRELPALPLSPPKPDKVELLKPTKSRSPNILVRATEA